MLERKAYVAILLSLIGLALGAVSTLIVRGPSEKGSLARLISAATDKSGSTVAQSECTPGSQANSENVYFISCGGIY